MNCGSKLQFYNIIFLVRRMYISTLHLWFRKSGLLVVNFDYNAIRLMKVIVVSIFEQVNSYPTVRGFTAIGTGGDDFVQAMVVAVESVIQQPIPEVIILCLFV